jgi:hypothetical protein
MEMFMAFEFCLFLGVCRFMEPSLLKKPPFQWVAGCGESIYRNDAVYLLTPLILTKKGFKKIK